MSYERARELLREAADEMGGSRRLKTAGAAVLVACVVVWWAWTSSRPAAPSFEVGGPGVAAGVASGGSGSIPGRGRDLGQAGSSAASGSPAAVAGVLVVDVSGAVRHPGVLSLPASSRVGDALAAAGGASSDGDPGALNLAERVTDGEKVYVPRKGEAPRGGSAGAGGLRAGSGGAGAGAGSGGGGQGSGGTGQGSGGSSTGASPSSAAPIDLNSASAAQLDTLPGIGPVLAQRIADFRDQHQRFASVDDLKQVQGIGPKKFEQIKDLVVVR